MHVRPCLRGVRLGCDVWWATRDCPGVKDDALMALSLEQKRVIVTFDRGIGSRAVRMESAAFGIVLVAPNVPGGDLRQFAVDLARRINLAASGLARRLTIFERARTRQRDLPDKDVAL